MQVRWTRPAQRSFNTALQWLAARNPQAAEAMRADVTTATTLLSEFPGAGQRVPVAEARSWLLAKWKKRIVYSEVDGAIVIVAFRDLRRQEPA